MIDKNAELIKWVNCWKETNSKLTAIKAAEMQKEDYLYNSLISLAEIFNFSLANSPPSQTSGLIEMQKYFSKLSPLSKF
jgi:hypothetical protein